MPKSQNESARGTRLVATAWRSDLASRERLAAFRFPTALGSMQLSRQRDDRRRRVLTDEVIGGTNSGDSEADGATTPAPRARRRNEAKYGEGGFLDSQPRISDLAPHAYWSIALLFCLGAGAIAGLEALYHYLPRWVEEPARVTALDLDSEGSLANWLTGMFLGMSALYALFVYAIRRNKADDYHGRYRIWVWGALAFVALSIDECASLHEGFAGLMTKVSGTPIWGDGSLWWILAYGLVSLAVGIRLAFQVLACRAAATVCAIGFLCWCVGLGVRLEWLQAPTIRQQIMLAQGLEMSGALAIFTGILLFCRYVILESQGLLHVKRPKSAKKPKRAASDSDKNADAKAVAKPGQTSSLNRPIGSTSASSPSLRVDSSHSSDRRLSKAERRAQRRLGRSDRDDD